MCVQTTAQDVSVAQAARRYALNANIIFKWSQDGRYTPRSAQGAVDAPVFLPIEIVNLARAEAARLDVYDPFEALTSDWPTRG